jgi:exodeoxyribonuclease V gamma subunit
LTVQIHVAPHPDELIKLVCDQLADPPDDPFAPELISVPTRGIERWITQRTALELAARGIGDGISANIRFPSPARLVRRTLESIPELAPSITAWEGPALTGHLLDVIDQNLDEPWMSLVRRYVTTLDQPANRLAAATKLTRLFTTYGRRRPGMIRAWHDGHDTGPDGVDLPDDNVWQSHLWRAVRRTIDVPHLAELLPEGLDPLRTGQVDLDLPERIMVYGLTAADPLDLQVLEALGHLRDVHLYVLHPSPALWNQTNQRLPTTKARSDDPGAHHPLLAAWARDARELQLVFAAHDLTTTAPEPQPEEPKTILAHLQHDIEHNRPPTQDDHLTTAVTDGTDRSVQIHVVHGARRQAEVARDAILHALAADPTLEPRDIVIMTPDLTTFAPLLEAAFPGEEARHNGGLPDLRLRIADRSPAAVNPLVRFAATVLDLAGGRLPASAVRELVTRPVVQHRFGFDADTADQIITLIDDAHIAWGIDATDREAWGAGPHEARTWSRGLDRALAGVFYSDSSVRVVADTAPLDGIEGQEARPVGILAALLDRIAALRHAIAETLPRSEWAHLISAGVRMLAAPAWGDEWQLAQLERLLGEMFPDADGSDPLLSLAEAQSAIAGWTDPSPSPLHFRTGNVTVCTLVPMRSVPYRVVCLVGMDDDRFPRSSRSDGDDLLLDHELVGDFDRSAQDRQLLLDALMAAGDHLIVTYSGKDELTNAELPPAVPIAELTDTLTTVVGDDAKDHLVTVHPLQPFSADNFIPGKLNLSGAFGFDPVQLAGAEAVRNRRVLPEPLPLWPDYEPSATLKLADVIGFLQHPARRFLIDRLGFSIPERGELPDDTLPTDLNALAKWGVKERLLGGMIDGYDLDALTDRETAADRLPPGALAGDDLIDAISDATLLWDAAERYGYDRSRMESFSGVVTAGDTAVEGAVLADPEHGHLATVTPSTLKGKHRLRAFAELVFLSVLEPEIEWQAVLLGRRSRDKHLAITVGPIRGTSDERKERALASLAYLVDLYHEGHKRPLPLPCESAYQWQRHAADLDTARKKVEGAWAEGWSAERDDPAHALLFPDLFDTEALLASGFVDYCERLWLPVLSLSGEKSL